MRRKNKYIKMVGWILLLIAIGFFCLQMGYFYVHTRFQVAYVDNRIFYIINMVCVICLALALLFLLTPTKKWKMIGTSVLIIFIIVNTVLLVKSNQQIKNIISISPDMKHVFSIKEDIERGEAVYYRSYYYILARPKERLPHETQSTFHVEWLENDVAAATYKATDNSIQQFVGTYGDRGGGSSYYYVGAEIQGKWEGNNAQVISNTEGISVIENGKTESFDWDHIQQFGTLAVVLMDDNEAAWTIALNKNIEINSNGLVSQTGDISLYKATLEKKNKPTVLHFTDKQE